MIFMTLIEVGKNPLKNHKWLLDAQWCQCVNVYGWVGVYVGVYVRVCVRVYSFGTFTIFKFVGFKACIGPL